jgi:hypothetical protein
MDLDAMANKAARDGGGMPRNLVADAGWRGLDATADGRGHAGGLLRAPSLLVYRKR